MIAEEAHSLRTQQRASDDLTPRSRSIPTRAGRTRNRSSHPIPLASVPPIEHHAGMNIRQWPWTDRTNPPARCSLERR